jgi:hypothetical protein
MSGAARGSGLGPELLSAVNPDEHTEAAPFALRDNDVSQFEGVSSEYKTYASDTEKPLDPDPETGNAPAEEEGAEGDDEDDDEDADQGTLDYPTL